LAAVHVADTMTVHGVKGRVCRNVKFRVPVALDALENVPCIVKETPETPPPLTVAVNDPPTIGRGGEKLVVVRLSMEQSGPSIR
jgi:hypothetical protein